MAAPEPAAARPQRVEVDVAIVGGGGAGLSLVAAIDQAARRLGRPAPALVVIDPVRRQDNDRTWCWWADSGPDFEFVEPLLARSWSRMEIVDRAGRRQAHDLGASRYVMLRSADFYAAADAALARLGRHGEARRIVGGVEAVEDGPDQAVVHAGATQVRARWVFDSRPGGPVRPAAVSLLQHFRGWTVRFDSDVLDPELPTLMDFRVPQPGGAVAFGYCLPFSARRALVEYTEFGREPLRSQEYDEALRRYLLHRWNVMPGAGFEVEGVEDGVIPMSDAAYPRRTGRRIFRLGTAGGATRPSTGYTFAAMQRQAHAVAHLLFTDRTPLPPRPYPGRHRWMDAVLLRALDRGYVRGPELFTNLFAKNPAERVVRFLDGRSGARDELALMRTTPTLPMLRSTVEDALTRGRRRLGR
jgi:lycopene beta-cyclase